MIRWRVSLACALFLLGGACSGSSGASLQVVSEALSDQLEGWVDAALSGVQVVESEISRDLCDTPGLETRVVEVIAAVRDDVQAEVELIDYLVYELDGMVTVDGRIPRWTTIEIDGVPYLVRASDGQLAVSARTICLAPS